MRRLELETFLGDSLGHLEGSRLETFIPDGQPVAVKVDDLDPVPAAVEEEEEMAGKRVLAEALLDQTGEAIERF